MTDQLTDDERAILLDPCACGHTLNDHGSLAGCWTCLDDEAADECDVTCEALMVERVGRIVDLRTSRPLAPDQTDPTQERAKALFLAAAMEDDQTDRGALVEALAAEFGCTPGPEMGDGREQPYRLCQSGAHAPALNFGTCEFAIRAAEALAPTVAALMTEHAARVAGEVESLLTAAEEITCTLGRPEGWSLGWHEAIELDRAARALRAALRAGGEGEMAPYEALSAPLSADGAVPGVVGPDEASQGAEEVGP